MPPPPNGGSPLSACKGQGLDCSLGGGSPKLLDPEAGSQAKWIPIGSFFFLLPYFLKPELTLRIDSGSACPLWDLWVVCGKSRFPLVLLQSLEMSKFSSSFDKSKNVPEIEFRHRLVSYATFFQSGCEVPGPKSLIRAQNHFSGQGGPQGRVLFCFCQWPPLKGQGPVWGRAGSKSKIIITFLFN